ncbi:MAG: ImmA/IrrE family metallo-endopeptidase [Oscillospiraceae bacterium]|nr:ImmA/IrrE family metallo-endopeptidase [Oscillospiraceae bacterium]
MKPNAQNIIILKPFAPVSFVYDYSDTEGEEFPEELLNPVVYQQVIQQEYLDKLLNYIKAESFGIETQAFGSAMSGKIIFAPKEDKFYIILNKNYNPTEKFAVLLHELGHFYCGHMPEEEYSKIPFRSGLSKEQQEFEAESVAYLVAKRMGIDCCSAEYLSDYLEDKNMMPVVSYDSIIRAVAKIEKLLKISK